MINHKELFGDRPDGFHYVIETFATEIVGVGPQVIGKHIAPNNEFEAKEYARRAIVDDRALRKMDPSGNLPAHARAIDPKGIEVFRCSIGDKGGRCHRRD
ncbi:hypothetical protein [Mesorhizobium sp. M0220]|uniref:hypothetical protein n=1 Tax=unclassified Mesorhizobium TaxID=325217 RepID=UPI00333B6D7F